jgi:serine O-acetyltransferase
MKYTGQQYFKTLNDLSNVLSDLLNKYLFEVESINGCIDNNSKGEITNNLIKIIEEDILALIKGDPAARKDKDSNAVIEEDVDYVISSYKSLNAVIMYRVAHFIYEFGDVFLKKVGYEQEDINEMNPFLRGQARKLSEETKVSTGVEIHPAAKIGLRFVIDHGINTVIGETCEIGTDCYILQGVVLGAREVNEEKNVTIDGRRHPKLEDGVVVCGCARIFGPIIIGEKSFICAYAVVDKNIPPKSRVLISNQIQIVSPNNHTIVIYGVRPKNNGLEIIGRNLNRCSHVNILDNEGVNVDSLQVDLNVTEDSLFLQLDNIEMKKIIEMDKDIVGKNEKIYNYMISLNIDDENVLISNSIGWRHFIDKLKKTKL